jgi:hypothetical protein
MKTKEELNAALYNKLFKETPPVPKEQMTPQWFIDRIHSVIDSNLIFREDLSALFNEVQLLGNVTDRLRDLLVLLLQK